MKAKDKRPVLVVACLCIAPFAAGAELSFVACPVYRDVDSGAKSGCWLATDPATGQRYDVSTANTKPLGNRPILVEGMTTDDAGAACGAPALSPVILSVLSGECTPHVLPAEGYKGRRYTLVPRHIEQLDQGYPAPRPPYTDRVFRVLFGFDRTFLAYQYDDWLIDQAVNYIRAAHPRSIIVTGYADTRERRVSGRLLSERTGLSRERAELVTTALRRLGVPADLIETRWSDNSNVVAAELADGLREPSRRRVDIDIRVRTPTETASK